MKRSLLTGVVAAVAALGAAAAEPEFRPEKVAAPAKNSAKEPLAKTFSYAKGAEFLDAASVNWSHGRKCATCHTNVVYLLARPAFQEKDSAAEAYVRKFFEGRVDKWDPAAKRTSGRDTEAVVTAVALAFHDAQTTGKLHPTTRKALDRMWAVQQKDGAWDWLKCVWPPLEHDDYFGAVFAAVGVGAAPDGYAKTEKAKAGLDKLRGYLKKTPAPSLHHKAWLMWASTKVDGLMTKAERDKTVKELLALQKADGGWSLPSLGDWKGYDGRDNDTKAPSDGYGTGLVVYLLRQAGLPADHTALKKGAAWLKANQRASGRWFTQSLNTDRAHYISHAGTAFAVMALKACE